MLWYRTCDRALADSWEEIFSLIKDKFKYCHSFSSIPLTIVGRISLGLFCSLKNDYEYNILVMLCLSLVFILYLMINLPSTDYLQNYRTVLVRWSWCTYYADLIEYSNVKTMIAIWTSYLSAFILIHFFIILNIFTVFLHVLTWLVRGMLGLLRLWLFYRIILIHNFHIVVFDSIRLEF